MNQVIVISFDKGLLNTNFVEILFSWRLVPAARYYPLRFHCIRSLNLLSQATDTYIPVAPFLLEVRARLFTSGRVFMKFSETIYATFIYRQSLRYTALQTSQYLYMQAQSNQRLARENHGSQLKSLHDLASYWRRNCSFALIGQLQFSADRPKKANLELGLA